MKNGPRDTTSVFETRYWLTEKGWAATEPTQPDTEEDVTDITEGQP